MTAIAPQFDALALLHEQHRLYTNELGDIHAALGKLFRKLNKTERRLQDKEATELTRTQYKKLWWTRTVTKQSIEKLEAQKLDLNNRLLQCQDLITSYETVPTPAFWPPTPYIVATSLSYPPTPFVMTPYTPYPPGTWPILQPAMMSPQQDPRCWDLSMLAEAQSSSTGDSMYTSSDACHDDGTSMDESAGSSAHSVGTLVSSAESGAPVTKVHNLPAHIDTSKANQRRHGRK